MLNEIDITTLEIRTFSGADMGSKYVPPSHPAQVSEKHDEMETYRGNCHCGNFKFSVKVPELKKVRICNCSICTRVSFQTCD
jgi:hypothetical protein